MDVKSVYNELCVRYRAVNWLIGTSFGIVWIHYGDTEDNKRRKLSEEIIQGRYGENVRR